jgi:hypothetical protein
VPPPQTHISLLVSLDALALLSWEIEPEVPDDEELELELEDEDEDEVVEVDEVVVDVVEPVLGVAE